MAPFSSEGWWLVVLYWLISEALGVGCARVGCIYFTHIYVHSSFLVVGESCPNVFGISSLGARRTKRRNIYPFRVLACHVLGGESLGAGGFRVR